MLCLVLVRYGSLERVMLDRQTHLKPADPKRVWYSLITSAPCDKAQKNLFANCSVCQQKDKEIVDPNA